MTVLAAFYTAAILSALALVCGFLTYRFRFVIWRGYFRAFILCEDGDIIVRTMRLKRSDTDFTAVVKGRADTYHIIDREKVTDEDRKKSLKEINDGRRKQGLDLLSIEEIPNVIENSSFRRVYRTGKFRIPIAFYNAHQSEPIDMQNLRKYSVVSATRYREIAKNTTTSQLLNAFAENPMKEAMMLFLGVAIVLGGLLLLGYFLNSRITSIESLVS